MFDIPGRCPVCRAWGAGGLCQACLAAHAAPRPRCACCAARTATPLPACGACLAEPPPFEATVTLADYGFPWSGLLARLKFQQQPELAATLAASLADAVRRASNPPPQLVLPVPLAPLRLRERGYNQAWELARRLATAMQLPAHANLLQRGRDTTHQIGLTRAERLRNLRHAFMVLPDASDAVAGRDVALVDDVMTTGATATACAHALRSAGARSVQLWVVARTPAPHET
jgi:ComF family protein